jgi:hypothetical protein
MDFSVVFYGHPYIASCLHLAYPSLRKGEMRSEHGVQKFAKAQALKNITSKPYEEVAKGIREDPETWLSLSLLWQSISLLTSTPSKARVLRYPTPWVCAHRALSELFQASRIRL